MFKRANTSQFQDRPTAGQGQASDIRREKPGQQQLQPEERRVRICEREFCRHQGQWSRREVILVLEQTFPAAPGADHGEAECPLTAHGGPHTKAGGCLKKALIWWEACAGPGFWKELWTSGKRSPSWNRFADRTCDLAQDPHWSSLFLQACTP